MNKFTEKLKVSIRDQITVLSFLLFTEMKFFIINKFASIMLVILTNG